MLYRIVEQAKEFKTVDLPLKDNFLVRLSQTKIIYIMVKSSNVNDLKVMALKWTSMDTHMYFLSKHIHAFPH